MPLAICLAAATSLRAEPLAVFEAREITGRDWPRTLVTYEVRSTERGAGSGEPGARSGEWGAGRAGAADKPERSGLSDPFDRFDSPPAARVTLAGPARPGEVRLVDAVTGVEVPFQLWDVRLGRKPLLRPAAIESARISFYAELQAGGSYRYELVPGKPNATRDLRLATPEAKTSGKMLTLDNGMVALRLPAVGERTFDPPLRFAKDHAEAAAAGYGTLEKAGLAFGPVAGIRLYDGTWVGGSYFAHEPIEVVRQRQNHLTDVPADAWERAAKAAPRVSRVESRVSEEGPLFVEAEVRFTFDNGGHYQLTARVLAGDPAVRIDEVMDTGANCPDADPLYVDFVLSGKTWKPDAACTYGTKSEPVAALDEALKAQDIQLGLSTLPVKYDGAAVTELVPVPQWGGRAQYLSLVDSGQLKAAKDAPFLAWIPQHAGSWRQAHWVFPPKSPHLFNTLFSHETGEVNMRWAIRAQPHSQNVLQTGEFDPAFGLTGMRRLWLLVGGPFQDNSTLFPLRAYEGVTNLDSYKDWTLAWDDATAAGVRLPVPPNAHTARGPLWHFNMALGHGGEASRWFSHYRQAQFMDWANDVQNTLSDPALPADRRGQLRAQVAAFCCLMSDPDFNTRASCLHQGNPNMPINRFFALPYAARLIPDHPLAGTWLDVTADYLAYKAGMNTAPGGAWSELISYYGASHPTLVNGALVCRRFERLDDNTARLVAAPLDFIANLLSPKDPRFGVRGVVGFGHETCLIGNYWTPGADLLRGVDPEQAAFLAWAWDQQGRPEHAAHGDGFAEQTLAVDDLVAKATPDLLRRKLASRWYPGFGAVLRDRPGTADEVYFAFRQGYLASHSDANQGDFALYAHGVPLTTLSIKGYAIHQDPGYKKLYDEFGWHSRVRFGRQSAFGGWPGGGPVSGVHRHFFGESLDYLKALGDYGPVEPGKLEPAEIRQRWTRQVLFLKARAAGGPAYFVFRDSFRAPGGDSQKLEQAWWYQRTLGTKEQVAASATGFVHTSEWGPKLQVACLQPAQVGVESRDATMGDMLGHGQREAWQKTHPGTTFSESMTVTALGPVAPGQDLIVAMFPLAAGQAAPRAESLADGVAKITTSESTDYVFAGVEPIAFRQGGVAFAGVAGAVRVYPDEVHLIIAEGAGAVSYKGYTLTAGKPVTKVVPLAEIAEGGTVEVPADPVTIAFALDPKDGEIVEKAPGARCQVSGPVTRWEFDSARVPASAERLDAPGTLPPGGGTQTTLLTFSQDGVTFTGRRGGIEVDAKAGTVRLVLLDGEKIGHGDAQASECSGPHDLTFHPDKVVGITEGPARFIHVTMPNGIVMLPALNLDGVRYAPGTYGNLAIIPVEAGRREWTLENLPQPPVFRDWVRW